MLLHMLPDALLRSFSQALRHNETYNFIRCESVLRRALLMERSHSYPNRVGNLEVSEHWISLENAVNHA